MDRRKFIAHSAALASTPLLLSGPAQALTALRMHQVESGTVKIGSELSGFYARPAGRGPFPGILLFMEAFGLNEHIQDVCKRLASLGYAALAPDFYHGKIFPYAERERAMAQLKTLDDDQVMAEAGQGLAFLAARAEVADGRLGTIGFCMGGRLAFLTNIAHGNRLRARCPSMAAASRRGRTPWAGSPCWTASRSSGRRRCCSTAPRTVPSCPTSTLASPRLCQLPTSAIP